MKQSWYKLIIKSVVFGICCVILESTSFAAPNPEGIQVYHKNMHLSEAHKQKLAADIYRYHNADNIWDELRHEFILPHHENNPHVQAQIDWFMNHPDYLSSSASRAAPYLYYISQQVRKRHLPAELVLLPMIESAYNPFAYSSMGAAGIWQMMPGTASGFGVKQDWWYDGRRDIVASTRAALDYLTYLGNFFDGNWLLSIAAYDTGEGNVLSAIKKNIRAGKNTDFWSLPLAQETRAYIPRLLALAIIISHPKQYPIRWPAARNAPYLAQIDIGAQIDLKHAAELAGLSLKKMKQFNSGHNRAETDPNGPFKLVLPIEHVQQFTENLARSPLYQRVNWIRYKIKQGDTLASIAKLYNMSPSMLSKANSTLAQNFAPGKYMIIPRTTPAISKTIMESQSYLLAMDNSKTNKIVPTFTKIGSSKPFSNTTSTSNEKYELQPGDTLYMVRNGDDLEKIAKRFKVKVNTIIATNQLQSRKGIRLGEQLIIPTHQAMNTAPNKPSIQKYHLTHGDTIYMVRKGDDIEKIAKKFRVAPSAIRLANLLNSNYVQEGDQLVIPTHMG